MGKRTFLAHKKRIYIYTQVRKDRILAMAINKRLKKNKETRSSEREHHKGIVHFVLFQELFTMDA